MKIDCISDLHGYYPKLEGGDLLIIAGDLTASDQAFQHIEFILWAQKLVKDEKYRKIIVVPGNHDGFLAKEGYLQGFNAEGPTSVQYLCDSGCEFEGLNIWGSPWTAIFDGINPRCMAFTCSEEALRAKWTLIPENTDILVTHCPPFGVLDRVQRWPSGLMRNVGSLQLWHRSSEVKPKLHVFGHVHGCGGSKQTIQGVTYVNCSCFDEEYEPTHDVMRIEL